MITFRPNCTLPGAPGGFVNASNVRSTMDIVWSCIGIIILSTWSILNPNIPPDFRKQAKWQLCLQKLYSVARKALWMIVMFVAPEALTSLYAHKMFSANHNHAFLEKLAAEQQVPWSRTHTLFADMGGFAIYFSDKKEFYPLPQKKFPKENILERLLVYYNEFKLEFLDRMNANKIRQFITRPKKENDDFIDRFELKQEFFFGWFGSILWVKHTEHERIALDIKNGLKKGQITHGKLQTLAALSGDIWVLDSAQLIVAAKEGFIELPKITKRELQDKNKSDALVKTLAIVQVLWLIIQLAARRYYGLASAPFEISTVAMSASTIILYILEWSKPKDVSVPIYILANKVDYTQDENDFPETTTPQETITSQGETTSQEKTTFQDSSIPKRTTISKEAFKEVFKKVFKAAPYPYLRFPIIPTKIYQIPSCAFHVAYSKDDSDSDDGNGNSGNSSNGNNWIWVKTAIIAVVSILSFGGIHIFAWNFFFPTKIEQQLWRVCSVAATVLPLPYLATHYPFMKQGTEVKNKKMHQIRTIQGVLALFYVLARLFLIIESLRSLYYLPRDAFESTWSVNFPHWG
ncbi:hypothetical protein THARTR1_03316 [Trichoderma harzianum]|uniref:Uncharacterized protein n=1 Tax=Trichoderma harzianum TaxID=5544 RepID=A0A2K0UFS9_TRIHA|nr:hypothetical protein THARTR1_03316 [Trichoderma harzianum]